MIKAVIFDLDNTLYDYDECNAPAMEKIAAVGAELFGCDKQKFLTTYDAAKTEVKRHFDPKNAAQHSRVFYIQKAAELSGVSPVGTLLPLYAAYWDTFIDAMRPYEGAAEFLRVLKENGIKTAICTDMTAYIQFRKIEKLGFASLIDAIVTSEEAGAEKPFPVNFHIALDKTSASRRYGSRHGANLRRKKAFCKFPITPTNVCTTPAASKSNNVCLFHVRSLCSCVAKCAVPFISSTVRHAPS